MQDRQGTKRTEVYSGRVAGSQRDCKTGDFHFLVIKGIHHLGGIHDLWQIGHAGAGSGKNHGTFRRLDRGRFPALVKHRLVVFSAADPASRPFAARHGPLNDRVRHRANSERRGIRISGSERAQDRDTFVLGDFARASTALPVLWSAAVSKVCRLNLRAEMHRKRVNCPVQKPVRPLLRYGSRL